MNLNLNQEQLNAVVSAAIMNAIGPEERDRLLAEAVKKLLTPEYNSYSGTNLSPIQRAFNEAASNVARKLFEEMVSSDAAFHERMKGMLAECAERLFTTNREKTIESMCEAVRRGLERDR